MTTITMFAIWAVAISGWYTAFHFYSCATAGVKPNMNVLKYAIIASVIGLALGCISLAAMNTIGAYHAAFKI